MKQHKKIKVKWLMLFSYILTIEINRFSKIILDSKNVLKYYS